MSQRAATLPPPLATAPPEQVNPPAQRRVAAARSSTSRSSTATHLGSSGRSVRCSITPRHTPKAPARSPQRSKATAGHGAPSEGATKAIVSHRRGGRHTTATATNHAAQTRRTHAAVAEPAATVPVDALRHGWATVALEAGVPMKVVQDRLNHASERITADIYTHVRAPMQSDATERVAGLLLP